MKLFNLLKRYSPSLEELPQFAIDQNVGALLYDEVVASGDNPFDTIGLMQLSQASQIQSKLWYVQKENIRRLSVFCAKHNIKMFIFKGYAMSLLYDKPESRKSGDVDVFFFNDTLRYDTQDYDTQGYDNQSPETLKPETLKPETINCSHKMDELVRAKGRELEIGDKHSSFNVRETHIENHRHFVGTEEHPKLQAVEEYLLKQINDSLRYDTQGYENRHPGDMLVKSVEWPNVYYPSPNFNAVFLPLHMGEHFVNEGSSLHQLLDWIVFLEKCGDQVDWDKVYELADRCGFRKWLEGISEFRNLGISELRKFENSKIRQKVLKELFASKQYDRESREHTPIKYLINRTIMTFRDGWKIRMVYDESPMRWFLRHAWNYVRNYGTTKCST